LCDILSHASEEKEKERKRILNIDLAVGVSQWLRETVYDTYRGQLDHAINLIDGQIPPCRPVYCHSEKELRILKKFLHNIENQKFIHQSTSPAVSPPLFVAKKDTTNLRLCIDYRALNKITVKN